MINKMVTAKEAHQLYSESKEIVSIFKDENGYTGLQLTRAFYFIMYKAMAYAVGGDTEFEPDDIPTSHQVADKLRAHGFSVVAWEEGKIRQVSWYK